MDIINEDCLQIATLKVVLLETKLHDNKKINDYLSKFVLLDETDLNFILNLQQDCVI